MIQLLRQARVSRSMKRFASMCCGLAALFVVATPAIANVIYDVTVHYSGSGHSATLTFAMEFAAPPPPSKSRADLLPSGDFVGEHLVVDGVQWTLVDDFSPVSVSFSELGFTFQSNDRFEGPGAARSLSQSDASLSALAPTFDLTSSEMTVVPRSAVPLPMTAALVAIAIAVLGVSRRPAYRRLAGV